MTIVEDREQVRIDGLLAALRAAEAESRRSYAWVLDVVAELAAVKVGAVAGFGATVGLLAGVIGEARGSLTGRRSPVGGVPDQRGPAPGDALVEAMTSRLDEGEPPTRDGQRPHVVITMRLTDLIDGLGLATLASAAPRDALSHRDQGCAFPGCRRPPRYHHAHRISSWLDSGETAPRDPCPLCEYHHTIVHRQGWRIRLNGRGHPEFLPPKTIDPARRPLHDPLRQRDARSGPGRLAAVTVPNRPNKTDAHRTSRELVGGHSGFEGHSADDGYLETWRRRGE